MGSPARLATFFDAIGKTYSMKYPEDKIQIQRLAYLGQESGIDLGYSFEWHRGGPYCRQVSADAQEAVGNDVPKDRGLDGKGLERFAEIIKPHSDDTKWLEIAAALLYLRKFSYEDKPVDKIGEFLIGDLMGLWRSFDNVLIGKVLAQMLQYGILRN